MEAFSLLKYWRGGGGGGGVGGNGGPGINVNGGDNVVRNSSGAALKTIKTNAAVSETNGNHIHNHNHVSETDDEEDSDEGPFFDLEFSLPDGNDEEGEYGGDKHGGIDENGEVDEEDEDCDDSDEDDEDELKFTLSSGSSGGESADRNISLSPSDDLFFKGRLVPVETTTSSSETNTKPQPPVSSLLKSATRFRVMMLKLKRSKQNSVSGSSGGSVSSSNLNSKEGEEQQKPEQHAGKSFTVKFKVEEVPIVSLFMRDNNSKSSKQKQNLEESVPDEKKFSKEAMQRYLKKVKPLYVRVSKRYVDKLKFSGQLSSAGALKATGSAQSSPSLPEEKPPIPPASKTEKETQTSISPPVAADAPPHSNLGKAPKQGSLPTGLRIVCKHLGKSRSASSAVAAAPPGAISSKRRDDSLLQQQDGIQGAILHCKRSFKASREELETSAILARSASDTSSYGKSGKNGGDAQPCSGSGSK